MDSEKGFAGGKTSILRPRTIIYAVVGLVVFSFAVRSRTAFNANLLRPTGAPYTVDAGEIRNVFRLKLVSKRSEPSTLEITPPSADGITFLVPQPRVTLPPMGTLEVPVIASMPRDRYRGPVQLSFRVSAAERSQQIPAVFLGP